MKHSFKHLSRSDISRIIEMAWEDRTSFEAIYQAYALPEKGVISLMRNHMKPSSFRMWRKRVSGRRTKHLSKRGFNEFEGPFSSPNKRI